ncbi:MAG: hypothetical protein ABWW69_03260 [Pyrodictiaceae archaeon]
MTGRGWESPLERDPELVLWDVINEYIDAKTAREVYGVVIDPARRTIDWEETRRLRQELRRIGKRCPEHRGLEERYVILSSGSSRS